MEIHVPLVIFTFFLSITGGTFACQGLMTARGRGKHTQYAALIVALCALVIGGLGSFTHLQHWERIFNGFGHITSGITIEVIACAVTGVAIVLFWLMIRRSEDGMAPKWCGIMAIVVGCLLPILVGTSYLMASLPVWNTPLLPLHYLVDALLMGTFVTVILTAFAYAAEDSATYAKYALIASAAMLVVVLAYAIYFATCGSKFADVQYYFDPTLPDVGMTMIDRYTFGMLFGAEAPAYWVLVVLVGCVLPGFIAWRMNHPSAKAVEAMKAAGVADGKAAADEPEADADGGEQAAAADDDEQQGIMAQLKGFFASVRAISYKKLPAPGKRFVRLACIGLLGAIVGSVTWRILIYVVAIAAFALY